MSRLIIKNLPKNITEEKLRNLFSQKGTITDIQLKYTKDGVFRQFAFIGFQNDIEAETALKYFNNSCIQTSRIKVEVCASLGGDEKPKSWSKHAKDSTAYRKIHGIDELERQEAEKEKEKRKKEKKNPLKEILEEHKDDPQFVEFMQVHTKNRNLWANDADMIPKLQEDDDIQFDKDKKSQKKKNVEPILQDTSNEKHQSEEEEEEDEENESEDGEESPKLAEKNISDLEYMKSLIKTPATVDQKSKKDSQVTSGKSLDLFTIKIHDIPYKTKRSDITKFFKPIKPYSVRLPTKIHGFCYVGFKTEKEFTRAMLKHKSFIKGKQVFFSDFTEKNKISKSIIDGNSNTIENEAEMKNSKWIKQEENVKNEEDISESGRIFFRNLAYTVTEENLQELFEKYGPTAEINLPIDPITRKIKAFGTVTYVMPEHAVQAFSELDGTLFHGRLLHLIPGKSKESDEDNLNEHGLNFKAKKALKQKQSANQSHNWNTLFLGPNAVADILAQRFETSKETILDSNSGGSSAAVRLALGETQIVIEMKRFLEENDVRLDVFETTPTKRSKTIILAKNLPAETTVADLRPLFSKFGLIGRIVLPPSGVTALIEFLDSSEAKNAFKKLAYSKFKNLPLYLEWAPENTFKTGPNRELIAIENEKLKELPKATDKKEEEPEKVTEIINEISENLENIDNDEPPEPDTTLFLRNLNFKTRENAVRDHFKKLGPIHIVQVAMRKDPENPKNRISLGYGFIQFKLKQTTEKALKTMQFTQIEGNQVELKRSDRILKDERNHGREKAAAMKQTGTKILVRNIPFQAKVNEVRDIFKAFGELKSVRLPKKMSPGEESHRGFGFVDFLTKSEAKKAFDALCQSTHLYGRRLVLEWAATNENEVDVLRKRTADNFVGSDNSQKRVKKSVFDTSNINEVPDDEEMD